MGRGISVLFQPKILLIFLVALLFIFLVSSFSRQEVEKVREVYEITHRVFFDVDIDKQRIGRIEIGLYGEVVPKTRILELCVQGSWGGDIVSGDGKGNQSIYGGTFRDENFRLKHAHAGWTVSMLFSARLLMAWILCMQSKVVQEPTAGNLGKRLSSPIVEKYPRADGKKTVEFQLHNQIYSDI